MPDCTPALFLYHFFALLAPATPLLPRSALPQQYLVKLLKGLWVDGDLNRLKTSIDFGKHEGLAWGVAFIGELKQICGSIENAVAIDDGDVGLDPLVGAAVEDVGLQVLHLQPDLVILLSQCQLSP